MSLPPKKNNQAGVAILISDKVNVKPKLEEIEKVISY
jgi:hypothetical protein